MFLRIIATTGGGVVTVPRVVSHRGSLVPRRIPARFGILDIPDVGVVLVDTGYHPWLRHALRGPARLYHQLIRWQVPENETLEARLRAMGRHVTDVSHVLLTHTHADHIAGLGVLPSATVWLTRTAWDHLLNTPRSSLVRHGYFTELLPPNVADRVRLLPEPVPSENLDECSIPWPVAPSVRVVPLPGHAPGHVGFLVERDVARVLFVGDATFSLDAIDTETLPSRPFLRLAFFDPALTRQTLRLLRLWKNHEPSLRIVPAHAWEMPDHLEFE